MVNHSSDGNIDRRTFVKGAGTVGAIAGGFATPAFANPGKGKGKESGGREPLVDAPVDFKLYWSNVDAESSDPDEPGDFGYPMASSSPTGGLFAQGFDPAGGGLFTTSEIEMTPNGGSLHHTLQFFQGMLMKSKPKPYTLVHTGDGRYESRGQVDNFEARSQQTIKALLERAGFDPRMADHPPISTLAGENWRAVATDRIQMETDDDGPTTMPEWGLTRVDFYSQGGGKPEYTLSLLYVIWVVPGPATKNPRAVHPIPDDVNQVTRDELIAPGRRNLGGQ